MKQRKLGADGPMVGALGLGCMSFGATASGATDQATSYAAMDMAWDMGLTHFDTANVYGPHTSEQIVGQWMADRGHHPSIATKAGIQRDLDHPVNNDPAYLEVELDGSLARLGVDHVDLFYIHRREQAVPIADVAGFMGRMVEKGKIGGWGLSEVSPTTLRLAHAQTPVRAVQNEYSLWTRQPELGLIAECAQLGVAFVAFSPLARGVFGRTIIDPSDPDFGPFRAVMPRFQPDLWPRNKCRAEEFGELAAKIGTTPPALALAWLLAQGDHIIPIPGTRTAHHMSDWADADKIDMTPALVAQIETILPVGWAWGDRYADSQARTPEAYC
ncbi:aldo/keto reductase [Yoonia sediminilitoris]|uniref:Aryl-alcohol dehydrogenase-like predicted oxidoreductase n=1 Tax=Yoonia sediminilitoris TaxID=1286148 RepID=A0A2T6KK93_9RHOB|nr:aldo/keto reductase [Yoonia sediminilitoris]PUB16381.1 aryl-alcohol dehydrogenase-like predicted oxidoreductase [Yoonia sediminilitoris]RCW96730.1 aryl-alcohol dehydrogenase-like predicted oxidoreductase [Yoonia sediminilitoris]